jgi:DNA-binding transcriptional LysR family regulator
VLTWDRLRVFAAVAQYGSVRAAAEALHITGPGVSQHLRKLEKEAGCQLLEPDGRGIRLTHAGRLLADSVRQMGSVAAQAELDLASIRGLVAGPLRIGAVASALRSLVPQVLRVLTARHERLKPQVRDGEAVQMLPALRAGQLDAVILESWTHWPASVPPGIRTTSLVLENALLAVSELHPFAARESVPLHDLREEAWASCPPGSDPHEALVQLLRAHGTTNVDVRYWVADYATQLQLVAAGLATALVPHMAAVPRPEGVRLVRCTPAVTRTVAVATVQQAEAPPVRAFVAEMLRAAHGGTTQTP